MGPTWYSLKDLSSSLGLRSLGSCPLGLDLLHVVVHTPGSCGSPPGRQGGESRSVPYDIPMGRCVCVCVCGSSQ